MIKTLFDPEGRMGPDAFLRAALILVVIGALLSLLPLVTASMMLSMVSLVLVYPWAVIWIKRLHDAAKPGWMFAPILVLYLIVAWGSAYFISQFFAPEQGPQPTDFSSAMAMARERAQLVAIPSAIVSVFISFVFVLIGNALLKSDPGPNAYDPPDHMR